MSDRDFAPSGSMKRRVKMTADERRAEIRSRAEQALAIVASEREVIAAESVTPLRMNNKVLRSL